MDCSCFDCVICAKRGVRSELWTVAWRRAKKDVDRADAAVRELEAEAEAGGPSTSKGTLKSCRAGGGYCRATRSRLGRLAMACPLAISQCDTVVRGRTQSLALLHLEVDCHHRVASTGCHLVTAQKCSWWRRLHGLRHSSITKHEGRK